MKRATVYGFFPELRGPNINKVGRGEATTAGPALARAMKDLLRQVKGRRVTIIKADITILPVGKEEAA